MQPKMNNYLGWLMREKEEETGVSQRGDLDLIKTCDWNGRGQER